MFNKIREWISGLFGRPKTLSGEAYLMVEGEKKSINEMTFDVDEDPDFDPSEIEGLHEGEFTLEGVRWGDNDRKIGFVREEE